MKLAKVMPDAGRPISHSGMNMTSLVVFLKLGLLVSTDFLRTFSDLDHSRCLN